PPRSGIPLALFENHSRLGGPFAGSPGRRRHGHRKGRRWSRPLDPRNGLLVRQRRTLQPEETSLCDAKCSLTASSCSWRGRRFWLRPVPARRNAAAAVPAAPMSAAPASGVFTSAAPAAVSPAAAIPTLTTTPATATAATATEVTI